MVNINKYLIFYLIRLPFRSGYVRFSFNIYFKTTDSFTCVYIFRILIIRTTTRYILRIWFIRQNVVHFVFITKIIEKQRGYFLFE